MTTQPTDSTPNQPRNVDLVRETGQNGGETRDSETESRSRAYLRHPRRVKRTPARIKRLCELLSSGCTRTEACKGTGISLSILRLWRNEDEALDAALMVAEQDGIDRMEEAMEAGALKVADDPRYSPLAQFMVINRRPERWESATTVNQRQTIRVDLAAMPEEELRRLAHAGGLDELPPAPQDAPGRLPGPATPGEATGDVLDVIATPPPAPPGDEEPHE